MAGLVLVCTREPGASIGLATVRRAAELRHPENIRPNPPESLEEPGLVRTVVNPVAGVRVTDRGVCLGSLFEEADWSAVGAPAPDGTFAILRHDAQRVELLSDVFASRTIWYVHTDDTFLASTSQRVLVALLGSYDPCPEAVSWLLASGNLGPEHGWDARLRRLPGATCLRLDRVTWTVTSRSSTVEYVPRPLPPEEHLTRLRDAVFSACAGLDADLEHTALTLSGGYDSRSLLVGMAHAGRPVTCVTWGLKASLADPKNDAFLARDLARRFGMPHEYFVLDPEGKPVRDGFTRFLRAGEGRVEDFSGYTDGFEAWRQLFEKGIATILRGDSPGWGFPFPPINDFVARSIVHEMTLVGDYPEGELIHSLGLAPQQPPEALFITQGETLDHYRDRIYNDFELPACMAAFNDVKCTYAEVANPLFARAVVQAATGLPDELRHMRYGFERIVSGLAPGVPFAEHGADEPLGRYLSRPAVVEEILTELSSETARRVFPGSSLDAVLGELQRPLGQTRTRLRSRVKAMVPRRLVRAIRPAPHPHLETPALAYRAYIASRMAAILREDAETIRSSGT